MVYSESSFKVEKSSKTTDTMKGTILVDATNQTQLLFAPWKIIRHGADCCSAVIIKESQAIPYVGLQRNRDSNMPHCSSYGCTNSTGKDSTSELYFVSFESTRELKQWFSGFVGIDSHTHRHSVDARRQGWSDLTMKTTTNSRHAAPHIPYINTHSLRYKQNSLLPSNEDNLQKKRANINDNFFCVPPLLQNRYIS